MKNTFYQQFRSLSGKYWLLQSIQMIERLVYSALVLQMAVYISQKDIVGGLHFEHTDKGIIFFFWALVQNLIPVIGGGFADRYGRKKTLILAVIIASTGYFTVAFQKDFYPFLFSVIIIGIGLGLYRPAIYGMIAGNIDDTNSSLAWSLNVMLINVAVFFSPPLAKYLEEISWIFLFNGLGLILLISIIPLLFLKEGKAVKHEISNFTTLKISIQCLMQTRVIYIILILSGFMSIYMQFYETLPNFIYDWIDTSMIVKDLNLPKFMSMETELGMMIDFKWLYNINSGFIILAVVFVSWLIKKSRITEGLIIGLCFSTLGLLISGWSQYGYIAVSGMLIYTLGEMITNPKFSEYMAKIAPSNQKSTYMGFINLSMALGLGLGSLIGGYLYNNYAEKSSLAKDFILNNYKLTENISHQNSVSKLMELKGLSYHHTTEFLWNTYNPQYIWLVFLFIGFASIISLYLYSRKFDKNT